MIDYVKEDVAQRREGQGGGRGRGRGGPAHNGNILEYTSVYFKTKLHLHMGEVVGREGSLLEGPEFRSGSGPKCPKCLSNVSHLHSEEEGNHLLG